MFFVLLVKVLPWYSMVCLQFALVPDLFTCLSVVSPFFRYLILGPGFTRFPFFLLVPTLGRADTFDESNDQKDTIDISWGATVKTKSCGGELSAANDCFPQPGNQGGTVLTIFTH